MRTVEYKGFIIYGGSSGWTIEDSLGFIEGHGQTLLQCKKYADALLRERAAND